MIKIAMKRPISSKLLQKRPQKEKRVMEILRWLEQHYPAAHCTLDHKNPFQLLVSTVLSAQCTDVRVNIVTKSLFKKYHRPEDYVKGPLLELEQDIRSTGFYHNKALAIKGFSKMILEKHAGKVPRTMEALTALPGVGRKTANVVLGNAFGMSEGVVVDTHVTRISGRLGLTKEKNPDKIEQDLIKLIPREKWTQFSHQLIQLGREICYARGPECERCFLNKLCPSARKV